MSKICGIYKITSPCKKVYIGQSVDIKKRFLVYRRMACAQQIKLYRSFKKYGVEKHTFEVIHQCAQEELNKIEIYYITLYNTFNSKYGLNLKGGGQNGGACSEETKNRPRKPVSKETREKLSAIAKVRVFSEATREKLRQRMMGNKHLLGKQVRLGCVLSAESKDKIRQSLLNSVVNKKPVIKIDLNGSELCEFPSVQAAADSLGINASNISDVLSTGKQKTAGGFKWKYKEIIQSFNQ